MALPAGVTAFTDRSGTGGHSGREFSRRDSDEQTDVAVFPNPADKNITITCQLQSHIRIADVAGKERITQTAGRNETVIDVSALAAGIYFVTIKDPQTTRRIKFVKQ